MWGWERSGLFKSIVAFLLLLGVSWLALDYLIPSPPSKITIASGPKGTTLDYYGQRYRDQFAKAGIKVVLRPSAGGVQNFRLLNDPKSGVDIAIVGGGVSNSTEAPDLQSLGLVFQTPIWVFYSSSLSLDNLSQLKGLRIAVGPDGSGIRHQADRILGRVHVTKENATLVPLAGSAAIAALNDRQVDVALILSGPAAPAIQSALKNPRMQLMNMSTAQAFTRVLPDLVSLVLPKGVVDLDPLNPPNDVTLVGTTANVLVRKDLHPAIIQLMVEILKREHDRPGLFQRTAEFPVAIDPDFPVSQIAVDYYKNGPSFLQQYLPSWMGIYAQRAIAFVVAALAIALPVFSFAPRLYGWFVQERLRKLYRRLRIVEKALQAQTTKKQIEMLEDEIAEIDRATDSISMRNSDLYFMLRYHLDRARSRIARS